jgi:hypothetical protein
MLTVPRNGFVESPSMQYFNSGWLYAPGNTSATLEFDLNTSQQYFITGGLTQTDGAGVHLYISMVCTISGDVQSCGVRDEGGDSGQRLQDILGPGASKVVFTLKSTGGGDHFGEVSIYVVP